MNTYFRALTAQIRNRFFAIKRVRRQPARPRTFRPDLELLEGRVVPSASGAEGLLVYNTLLEAADHIEIAVADATQLVLTNTEPLAQAIGPAFVQSVATQLETDLAPLANIQFGTQLDGLFRRK